MSVPVLVASSLSKSFNGVNALRDFSCELRRGEVTALIGPNGAGKTTFFNVVGGFTRPDAGDLRLEGHDILHLAPHMRARLGISRTFQDLRLIRKASALENLLLHLGDRTDETVWKSLLYAGSLQAKEAPLERRAHQLLRSLGLEKQVSTDAGELSYGQQKLLALACCVAREAEVVLLDEPLAGVSPALVERILDVVTQLRAENRAVLVIEHDTDAVVRVCDRVIFMDAGAKVAEGSPEDIRSDPRVMKAYLQ